MKSCNHCGMAAGHTRGCTKGQCQHCGEFRATRPRGLCHHCHGNLRIRVKYANSYGRVEDVFTDPTQEELDAILAETMAALPSWWNHASERQDEEYVSRPGIRVVRTFQRRRLMKRTYD
jgi:hypothetical protein